MARSPEGLTRRSLLIAFMRAPLNSVVIVRNTQNGISVVSRVTDRGHFEYHGFIADLNLASRDLIRGGHLTEVEITLLEKIVYSK